MQLKFAHQREQNYPQNYSIYIDDLLVKLNVDSEQKKDLEESKLSIDQTKADQQNQDQYK